MDYVTRGLLVEGNNYYVKDKKSFRAYGNIKDEDKKECFEFAFDMSYGDIGEHRSSRSGGTIHRKHGQIFINTFQGKMAEFALYRFLLSKNIETEKPDITRNSLGKWDSFDLQCQGKHISVKSTKSYGNLLLLEEKDWNDNGEYTPNRGKDTTKYDYTVLVRFNPDGEKIMRDNRLLYQKNEEIPIDIKDILTENIFNKDWSYDFPGFVYYSEVVKMIRQRKIIPKGAMLNGRTKMDATNYYFQTGDMHAVIELYTPIVGSADEDKGHIPLERRCPKCGKRLIIRQGYNYFWGCEGYADNPQCRYHEAIENKR